MISKAIIQLTIWADLNVVSGMSEDTVPLPSFVLDACDKGLFAGLEAATPVTITSLIIAFVTGGIGWLGSLGAWRAISQKAVYNH